MSEITKNTHATLHQLVAGEDTVKEESRLGDLVLRYISLSSSQRPEYFIMIGQVEYLPKQIERWARDFGDILPCGNARAFSPWTSHRPAAAAVIAKAQVVLSEPRAAAGYV